MVHENNLYLYLYLSNLLPSNIYNININIYKHLNIYNSSWHASIPKKTLLPLAAFLLHTLSLFLSLLLPPLLLPLLPSLQIIKEIVKKILLFQFLLFCRSIWLRLKKIKRLFFLSIYLYIYI